MALSKFFSHSVLTPRLAETAWACVDGQGPDGSPGVWLCHGLSERIEATEPEQVGAACARIEAQTRTRHGVVLLDYELGYWLEPRAAQEPQTPSRPPLTGLIFDHASWYPREVFEAELAAAVAALPESLRHAGIAELRYGRDRATYRTAIERILHYIHEGDCYQINFTWPMRFQSYGAPLALYYALWQRQPVEHGAFVQLPDRSVLSLSPELFLTREGTRLHSKPMKGTAPRGQTPEEDERLAQALRASEKDQAENVMIVDLIRNDLGRVATPGTVEVSSLFDIERYPTVLQMVSTVAAEAPNASLQQILHALFPCGSITGAPKIRAMQIAQELEAEPRHLYTGSIGLIRPGGDFSFNVAIRTLEIEADGSGRLGIGSGIVADSDPDLEYDECLVKARFATDLPATFELIETMRLEPAAEAPFPLLEEHLARLAESARHYGFHYDEDRLRAALDDLRQQMAPAAGPQRVRLSLAKSGTFDIQCVPLPALVPEVPTVVIAPERVESGNSFLRHKTTVRGLYNETLQRIAALPDCFDALFFNERDELTEGARSNVFIVRDGRWYTPPLESGLLNGVMRRVLLRGSAPAIEERVLRREDLFAADEIYLANALRGLFRVQLAGSLPVVDGAAA